MIGEELNSADNTVLEFCAVAHSPYLLQRKYFKPAGRNLIYFFRNELPQRIIDIKIALAERVIMLMLESGFVFITLRGKDSNIFFSDRDLSAIQFVRKTGLDLNRIISENIDFIEPDTEVVEDIRKMAENSTDPLREMRFLGKEVLREVKTKGDEQIPELIATAVHAVLIDKLLLLRDASSGSYSVSPESFFIDQEVILGHTDVTKVLQEFIVHSRKQSTSSNTRKLLMTGIKRELDYQLQKEEKLVAILGSEDRSSYYDKVANLLMISRDEVPKGADSVELSDLFEEEKRITIRLKEELTIHQNIERYFRKARGEKMKFENAKTSLSETRQKIVDLKAKLNLFESMEPEQFKDYSKRNNVIPKEEKAYPNNARIRKFVIDEKWEVLVGKDSESNDVLTLKVAKQSDYWFHARGSSGSHAVLRYTGKDKPPKEIIKKVAQLAAFYSRAKNSKLVPVAYTQKKYVGKRKGMNPGQVFMLREEVVMVPPEIPVGCSQENEDQ